MAAWGQSRHGTYLELGRIRADDRVDLLAILEKDKGRHGTNTDFLRDLALLIDIDLVEADLLASGRVRDLFKDGADHLARATPRRPEVDDHNLVTASHLLELLVRSNHLHNHDECVREGTATPPGVSGARAPANRP